MPFLQTPGQHPLQGGEGSSPSSRFGTKGGLIQQNCQLRPLHPKAFWGVSSSLAQLVGIRYSNLLVVEMAIMFYWRPRDSESHHLSIFARYKRTFYLHHFLFQFATWLKLVAYIVIVPWSKVIMLNTRAIVRRQLRFGRFGDGDDGRPVKSEATLVPFPYSDDP